MDDLFTDALLTSENYLALFAEYGGKLSVQTASPNVPPLDALTSEKIGVAIEIARDEFDEIYIDMPLTLPRWSEAVLSRSDYVMPVARLGVREARNMAKLLEMLQEAQVDFGAVEPVLNFAPTTLGLVEKSKARKFETSIGLDFQHWLPDGGREAARAMDAGAPLSEVAKRNPLRVALSRMAKSMDHAEVDASAAQ